jgi:hypothetical protein
MRIVSSAKSRVATLKERLIPRGILCCESLLFNRKFLEDFESSVAGDSVSILSEWDITRGLWQVEVEEGLTTTTSASAYPIIRSYDMSNKNIKATIYLQSGGPGVVFWMKDEENWWAATTFFVSNSEPYRVNYYENSTRSRFNYYLRLLKSENGVVETMKTILIKTDCSDFSDLSPCTNSEINLSAIEIETKEGTISINGIYNSQNLFGDEEEPSVEFIDKKFYKMIQYNAGDIIRGNFSGIIYTPGSNYQESSEVYKIVIEQNRSR